MTRPDGHKERHALGFPMGAAGSVASCDTRRDGRPAGEDVACRGTVFSPPWTDSNIPTKMYLGGRQNYILGFSVEHSALQTPLTGARFPSIDRFLACLSTTWDDMGARDGAYVNTTGPTCGMSHVLWSWAGQEAREG